jgi:putative tryptophan/tyrosine transport system substrate-binding protein
MNRRAFVTGLGAVLVAPLGAEAQPAGKLYRVGYLSSSATVFEAFRLGLRELGYVEGQNLSIEARLAAGKIDRLPVLAVELVRARVDVIAAVSPPAIAAAKKATTAIPIVMAFISVDPVRSGFVDSLSRPGGNITGVAMIADDIAGKRLALLKEMLPSATRIALLAQVNHSSSVSQAKAARETARTLGVELQIVEARDVRDYDAALGAITKSTPGVFILANPTFFDDRERLAAVAVRHRLASLCEWGQMAEAGCLMSYGPNISDLYRRVGAYVDRILKGAKPSNLPVEQPTKFELVINLKTAKALGLTIPPSLLLRADQVIDP